MAKFESQENLPKHSSIPNQRLQSAIQEVVDDLSGREKLPEAHSFKELNCLLNDESTSNY